MRKIIIIGLLAFYTLTLIGCGSKEDIKEKTDAIELTQEETKGESTFDKFLREQEEKEVKEEELKNVVLTIDNDEEFMKNMIQTLSTEAQAAYFESIVGRTVEFDGAIDYVDFLPEKKTRLTFSLRQGSYDPNSITGPAFIIPDVGAPDDSVREAIQAGAKTGTNVRIKAEIKSYDIDKEAVVIKPVKISIR